MNTTAPALTERQAEEGKAIFAAVKRDHRQHYGDAATVATFRPLDGFVLFEREPLPDRAGAIVLVAKSERAQRTECTWARVLKLGDPLMARKTGARIPFTLKVGQRVLLDRLAGHDIVLSGKSYVLAIESDVHLVEEPA